MADLHLYFEQEWGMPILAIIMPYRDGHSATMQIAYMKLMAHLGKSAKQVYKEMLGVYTPG
jgi:hypothetical protein